MYTYLSNINLHNFIYIYVPELILRSRGCACAKLAKAFPLTFAESTDLTKELLSHGMQFSGQAVKPTEQAHKLNISNKGTPVSHGLQLSGRTVTPEEANARFPRGTQVGALLNSYLHTAFVS